MQVDSRVDKCGVFSVSASMAICFGERISGIDEIGVLFPGISLLFVFCDDEQCGDPGYFALRVTFYTERRIL